MPHASYDMRQSKDVSKGKGGKRKKYTILWNFITCPWSCRNALFQGFVNFFTPPNHPPSQQTRALLLARAGTAFLQVDSCVWWPDEDVVFSYCVYIRKQLSLLRLSAAIA